MSEYKIGTDTPFAYLSGAIAEGEELAEQVAMDRAISMMIFDGALKYLAANPDATIIEAHRQVELLALRCGLIKPEVEP